MSGRTINVKVIGCGGIGGALLPILCRYLDTNHQYSEVSVTLIDGDSYEPHNASRQVFTKMTNKAMESAELLSNQFRRIKFFAVPQYLTAHNIVGIGPDGKPIIGDGDVIFSCVDNHAARKIISDRCESLKEIVAISGGNGYTDGNIQVHIRKDGKNLTLPIANEFHNEIRNPTDENPGDKPPAPSCGCQAQAPSAPQLLITNNLVAAAMLNCFYQQQEGGVDYDEVYLDVRTNAQRPVRRMMVTA